MCGFAASTVTKSNIYMHRTTKKQIHRDDFIILFKKLATSCVNSFCKIWFFPRFYCIKIEKHPKTQSYMLRILFFTEVIQHVYFQKSRNLSCFHSIRGFRISMTKFKPFHVLGNDIWRIYKRYVTLTWPDFSGNTL